ncbi:hypothetical protein CB1_000119002 [Camelus ferus]|nr:hypothetical protein CB1_000119002 [Camelus ferus]
MRERRKPDSSPLSAWVDHECSESWNTDCPPRCVAFEGRDERPGFAQFKDTFELGDREDVPELLSTVAPVIYLSSTQMASCLCVTVTVSLDDFEQSFLFWIRHTLRTKDQAVFRRHTPCRVLAVLLHYFFLSAFAWMLVEGLHLYSMVIKVFGSEDSKRGYYYGMGWEWQEGKESPTGQLMAKTRCFTLFLCILRCPGSSQGPRDRAPLTARPAQCTLIDEQLLQRG